MLTNKPGPIGVFDSGYGGLTILREFVKKTPGYDFIYLGDNARAPYGSRSFHVVYRYTLEAVKWLFARGCHLVILACNTASAKALRSIQQHDLPGIDPLRRVLGVIRPSVEALADYTRTGHVGILGTVGTVSSQSYPIEIHKLYPDMVAVQQTCPLWVSLVESGEINNPGADYFVKKYIRLLLEKDDQIDAVILACTHYPLLMEPIRKHTPDRIRIISQDAIVALSLADYLKRHPEMDARCTKGLRRLFYTTDDRAMFEQFSSMFFGEHVRAERAEL